MVLQGFGQLLTDMRKYKKLTINELAEGICTEDELRSFEREKNYPRIDQLQAFAVKLNIDLNYFFDLSAISAYNYTSAVAELINKYKRERNYLAISNIIQSEKENSIYQQIIPKQYLQWHEGICVYYLDKNINLANELLFNAIDYTNPSRKYLTEREIEILTSIAILQKEESNFREAITIYIEALTNIESLPKIVDQKAKLRIYFGLSQALTEIGQYQESLSYSNKGIELCHQQELLYLYSEFYYQSGENHIKLGNIETGKDLILNAIFLQKLHKNDTMVKIMEKELEKLLN